MRSILILFVAAIAPLFVASHLHSEEATPSVPTPALGEFGSDQPVERADLPARGILNFKLEEKNFVTGEHWEQYNFPFKSKRWGKYAVRISYVLKSASLGVQFKFGEERLKKQLTTTAGQPKHAWLGKIYIPTAGDQLISLFTPKDVAGNTFELLEISLVPAAEGETISQAEDGSVVLLAKDAVTWSENLRYEPKPEKTCLGFWTLVEDFAEWEFRMLQPGTYKVTLHQGSKPGGSEATLEFAGQKLDFTVKNTGGFNQPEPVVIGEVKVDKPGTYRLAVKPRKKVGGAIMDIHKVVLAPAT